MLPIKRVGLMEYREFELMFRDEQTHWWYKARRRIVDNYLGRVLPEDGKARIILDIASACGANFNHYKKYGEIYGIDVAEESITFCRSKGINRIIRGDVHNLPFASESFDVVIALDALEHFKDDLHVLREIKRVLKKRGMLIINSPALNILWSQHDKAFHHERRYSAKELKNKLKTIGYEVEFSSYWMFFLFLPALIFRKGKDLLRAMTQRKSYPISDMHTKLSPLLSFILDGIGRVEAYIINKKISFPLGVSFFCVARKVD